MSDGSNDPIGIKELSVLYLEFIRRQQGLSQARVMEGTSVHRNTIIGIESGRVNPTPDELRALASFFQIEPADRLLTQVTDPFTGELGPR